MTEAIKNELTPKQIEVIEFDLKHKPRLTILEGAIRSAKTTANIFLFINHVADFKNRQFIITGTSIASIKRNVLDDITRLFNHDTTLNQKNEFKLFGNTIICFGTDSIDSYKAMKGFTAYGWLGNEVTEHHINSIDQAFKRCSGKGARIFWDTNPSFPDHFIKTQFMDRDGHTLPDGKLDVKTWHFVLDDNTKLSPEYVESIKRSTPMGMWYDRDILGLWVAAEGMIYKDFDYTRHVLDELPKIEGMTIPLVDFFAGQDWGYDHLGVFSLYGTDHDGRVYRILEIAEREKGIDWWGKNVLDIKLKYGNLPVYCDPARPDNISEFRKYGINAREAKNAVIEGISFVAGLFKANKYFIIKSTNSNCLKERYMYRWRDNQKKEEPIKENDDSMDSERYALYSHIGHKPTIQPMINLSR
jgi:PBSX family phage terminase large subunit